tara:strand:- start:124 stop:312 length:189 start_codon:yes stop_codon:yes gene_type:complete
MKKFLINLNKGKKSQKDLLKRYTYLKNRAITSSDNMSLKAKQDTYILIKSEEILKKFKNNKK